MKTQQYHTTIPNNYLTTGNLALAPVEAPVFTVIEGGYSHKATPDRKAAREQRRARAAEEARMRVYSLVATLVFMCILVTSSMLRNAYDTAARNKAYAEVTTMSITVGPGDSLWEIAEHHPVEGRSVRDVTSWISEINGLSTATLMVGQELLVPAV
ncbi:MAG: LysM peptidoglycan-binding domain-containing protein [Coriobacteriales bacterium]|nr:LysM peptidoglycan-binding domain-containing protein [Coriobacteriales bacterium]